MIYRNNLTYPNLGALEGTNAEALARVAARMATFIFNVDNTKNYYGGSTKKKKGRVVDALRVEAGSGVCVVSP